MSKEKLSGENESPSTIELLQKELKQGGQVFDTLTHQLTDNLYDTLSGYGLMTDLDSLYDIIEKSVKTSVGVWAGGNTEPIVTHDAAALAEEQKSENPDLDTRKSWNDPAENLAVSNSDTQETTTGPADPDPVLEKTSSKKKSEK